MLYLYVCRATFFVVFIIFKWYEPQICYCISIALNNYFVIFYYLYFLFSHNTGTDMSDLSISLNACPCCAVAGRSGDKLSCLVVVEFIVVLFAQSTPN